VTKQVQGEGWNVHSPVQTQSQGKQKRRRYLQRKKKKRRRNQKDKVWGGGGGETSVDQV